MNEADDKSEVEEGEPASFVVELEKPVSSEVRVDYATGLLADSAKPGSNEDYAEATGTLTFTVGDTSRTIEVTTHDDGNNEGVEEFTVRLTGVSQGPSGVVLDTGKSSATGTIRDNDPLEASVSRVDEEVDEGDDAEFTVTLTGGTSTAVVVVTYELDSTSTAAEDEDYTAPSGTLEIAAGDPSGTITIATLTDQVLDPDETLVVKLTGASTAGEATVNAATATTTIDDTGMVKVSVSAETVADDTTTLDVNEADDKSEVEEGEPASFVVELEKPVSSEVRVDYATGLLADSAKPGSNEDYAEATGTLTFTVGDTSRTIEVTTHDDGNNEGVEEFTVRLTGVSQGPSGVALDTGKSSATGTIRDNDALEASVSRVDEEVDEGEEAEFTVTLTGGTSTAAVVVTYELDSTSTAAEDEDYTAPSGTLEIAAGDPSGTITIATLTDQVLDPDEKLVVKLTGASTAGEATVNAATATTTIDDTGMVKVSVSAETVADDTTTLDVNEADDKSEVEEGEPASFVVELEKPVSSEVRVDYATGLLADSAKPGSNEDYAEATGTLTFTVGDTSRTIEVTTHDDGNNEGVEEFTVRLTGVSQGPSGVALDTGKSSATGTIRDNDALEASVSRVDEEVDEGEEAEFTGDADGRNEHGGGGGDVRGG